jgi:hypothetical protein
MHVARRHEDVWGGVGCIDPHILEAGTTLVASGQLHAC